MGQTWLRHSAGMTTSPVRRRVAGALMTCGVLTLALGGCTSEAPTAGPATTARSTGAQVGNASYTVVSQPTLKPGDPAPAPTGKVVLTLTGDFAQGPEVELDLAGLERLGTVEYSVLDKQAEGRRATFRGVLVSTLLQWLGAKDATTMHAVALNDYAVDIPVADASTFPLLLATSVDGERMSVERYGPTRFVYPTDGVGLDPTVYDPRWIWQLKSIEVE